MFLGDNIIDQFLCHKKSPTEGLILNITASR